MTPTGDARSVALWLFLCAALVYAMIVLGGVTRLTQSGLSMVNWEPVMGIVPPLSDAEWQATFEQYRSFPEYQQVNRGMSLAAFKQIFYVEYAHRILGRLIGVAFLVPLLVFVAVGRITRPMIPRFATMFALGALQGLMGWFMVMSGLVDRPSVSQYRLTAHLLLAVVIYAFILWTALGLWRGTSGPGRRAAPGWGVLALVVLMIASGGFVAGTHAGFVYNTFPLMGADWLPAGAWSLTPGWRNLFENVVTIQFTHRVLAALVALAVLAWWVTVWRLEPDHRTRGAAHLMALALVVQVMLGISTLLLRVPVVLGAAHQAGAIALLSLVLIHLHLHRHPRPDGAALGRPQPGGRVAGVQDRMEPL